MSNDLISRIALVLSAVSLIPVLYSYFRRYVAKLDFFDKGFVIVGFSRLGSVISVPLTLRSWHFDLFLSQMTLTVKADNAVAPRDLEMTLFRYETMVTKAGVDGKQKVSTDGQIEMAHPMLLYEKSPKFVDIVFSNAAERVRIASRLDGLKRVVNQINTSHSAANKPGIPDLVNDSRFIGEQARIRQELFWAPGEYTATMSVVTHRPTKTFTFKFRFALSSEDIQALEANDLAIIIEGLGGEPAVPPATRYPVIKKIE